MNIGLKWVNDRFSNRGKTLSLHKQAMARRKTGKRESQSRKNEV